jgi:hypothetical protein
MLEFLKNKYSRVILGIIWGLGLASIFRCACNGRKCIVFKAPIPADVINHVYNYNEKCYKYDTVHTDCDETAIT